MLKNWLSSAPLRDLIKWKRRKTIMLGNHCRNMNGLEMVCCCCSSRNVYDQWSMLNESKKRTEQKVRRAKRFYSSLLASRSPFLRLSVRFNYKACSLAMRAHNHTKNASRSQRTSQWADCDAIEPIRLMVTSNFRSSSIKLSIKSNRLPSISVLESVHINYMHIYP